MKIQPKYSIDNIPGTFGDRVFIGGNYLYGSRLEDIADAVTDCGLTPIIARQFIGVAPGTERHSSLYLLERCKLAIFELSSEAGQLIELENALNFSTITLCVWDAYHGDKPKISAMVTSHPLFQSNNRCYKNTRELQYYVYDFLKQEKAQ